MSKTYIPMPMRRAVYQREGEVCHLCTGREALDLHHVRPEYAGGGTVAANLTPLCSNKLGGNACHILVHAAYRSKEKQLGRALSFAEYASIVAKLAEVMHP